MKQYANLHFHSTHSDGAYTLEHLIEIAKSEGYAALAVTDHDTMTGNAPLKQLADREGMETLFGTEFSTGHEEYNDSFHIVAFNYDPTYAPMAEYLEHLSYNERHQTEVLFHKGKANGFLDGLKWEDVLADYPGVTWLCNEHVFRSLKKRGLRTDADYPAFFRDVYGSHRCEIPWDYPFLEPKELLALIRDAGGIPVLAHPHRQLKFVPDLIKEGLLGIEVWHPDVPAEEQLQALKLALEHHLYISGGSDHSGLMGGQYERYPDDPTAAGHYIVSGTAGTQKIFFEEIKTRTLAPDKERRVYLDSYRKEVEKT